MNNGFATPPAGLMQSPQQKTAETQDNIPIRVSGGEVVLSADEVRYLGLEKINKIREKAKEGMAGLMTAQAQTQTKPMGYASGGYVEPQRNSFAFDPVVYARMIDSIQNASPSDTHVVAPTASEARTPTSTTATPLINPSAPNLVQQIFGNKGEGGGAAGGGNAGLGKGDTATADQSAQTANSFGDFVSATIEGLGMMGPVGMALGLMGIQAQHDIDNDIDSPAAAVGRSVAGMTATPNSMSVTNAINRGLENDWGEVAPVTEKDFNTETTNTESTNTENSKDATDNSKDSTSNAGIGNAAGPDSDGGAGTGADGNGGDSFAKGGFVKPKGFAMPMMPGKSMEHHMENVMKKQRRGLMAM